MAIFFTLGCNSNAVCDENVMHNILVLKFNFKILNSLILKKKKIDNFLIGSKSN